MADIRLAQGGADAVQRIQITPQPIIKKDLIVQDDNKQKERASRDDLENVIAVSEDGDTVQASDEGMDLLHEEEAKGELQKTDGKLVLSETGEKTPIEQEGKPAQERTEAAASREKKVFSDSDDVRPPVDEKKPVLDDVEVNRPAVSDAEEKKSPEEEEKSAIEGKDDRKPLEEEKKSEALNEKEKKPFEEEEDPVIGQEEKKNPYLEEQKKALLEPKEKNPVIEEKKSFERDPSSFVGYSESQLQELYYKDRISRNEYNQELESREEQREFLRVSNEAMTKDMIKGLKDEEALRVTKQEMKIVFSNEPLNGILPEERVKIIDSLQNITLAGEASVPTRG